MFVAIGKRYTVAWVILQVPAPDCIEQFLVT